MKKWIVVSLLISGLSVNSGFVVGQTSSDPNVPRMGREEVKKALDKHKAIFVEALPPKYFKRCRLPGSLNITMKNAEEDIPKLLPDKKKEIIVYCMDTH